MVRMISKSEVGGTRTRATIRCGPDHDFTVGGPRFGRRLAAHEEIEGELVRGVPDRQGVGVGTGLQAGVGVGLELDPRPGRWLTHTGRLLSLSGDRPRETQAWPVTGPGGLVRRRPGPRRKGDERSPAMR